ncbi:MAG: glycosyltransferase family 39 protein [Gemmatimonadota bacterium]
MSAPGSAAAPGVAAEARGWWLLLGAALGVGLLTKFTILVLGAGILTGLLLSPLRRWLRTPWPWIAAALAFLIGSPSFIGQAALGWPFFEQVGDLQSQQLSRISPVEFALSQVLQTGPVVLVGVAAAVLLVTARRLRPLRVLGWTSIVGFLLMMAAGGKPYYIGPLWPALIGNGTCRSSSPATRSAHWPKRGRSGRASTDTQLRRASDGHQDQSCDPQASSSCSRVPPVRGFHPKPHVQARLNCMVDWIPWGYTPNQKQGFPY